MRSRFFPLSPRRSVFSLVLLILTLTYGLPIPTAHATTVNSTNHVKLGFTASIPISKSKSDTFCVDVFGCVFSYSVSVQGAAEIALDLEADITLSYDTADIVPGGSLPLRISYTPKLSFAAIKISGDAKISFTGCSNCPATLKVGLATGLTTFTPPLDSDPAVALHGVSDRVGLGAKVDPFGTVDFVNMKLDSTLTLSPASPEDVLGGLAGAVARIGVDNGAKLEGLPLGVVQWNAAGQSRNFNIVLPPTPAKIHVILKPVLHWLGTSADIKALIDFTDAFKALVCALVTFPACLALAPLFASTQTLSIFSGSLGSVYTDPQIRLDQAIATAVGGDAGPHIASRVADGFIPVPLLQPPLSVISLSNPKNVVLGSSVFTISFPFVERMGILKQSVQELIPPPCEFPCGPGPGVGEKVALAKSLTAKLDTALFLLQGPQGLSNPGPAINGAINSMRAFNNEVAARTRLIDMALGAGTADSWMVDAGNIIEALAIVWSITVTVCNKRGPEVIIALALLGGAWHPPQGPGRPPPPPPTIDEGSLLLGAGDCRTEVFENLAEGDYTVEACIVIPITCITKIFHLPPNGVWQLQVIDGIIS